MPRAIVALRPQPTARRPFSALVISPQDNRRDAFTTIVERAGAHRVMSCDTGCDACTRGGTQTRNDVCVIDGATHDTPVLVLVRQLRTKGWRRIILVSARHDVLGIRAAALSGVHGYVVSSRRWAADDPREQASMKLTGREVEVLQAVANGMSNKDIGAYLGLSSLTVKSHMARISRKLGTGDRARLVAIGMRTGVIS